MPTLIVLILLIIVWFIGVYYLAFTFYTKLTRKDTYVPFIPIDKRGLDHVFSQIKLSENSKIIDIGSGWGTVLFYLAKSNSKLLITGIELNPLLTLFSKIRKFMGGSKYKNINIITGDASSLEYSEFETVFLFMLPGFVQKVIIGKLEKELKKGAVIISYVFPVKSDKFEIKEIQFDYKSWRNKMYICTKK